MKLKNALVQIILFLLPAFLWGQVAVVDSEFEPKLCGEVFEMPSGFKGSQYYNQEWALADITLTNRELVRNKYVRYNGFLDELIWKNESLQKEVKLEKYFIKEFTLAEYNGKSIRFKQQRLRLPFAADSSTNFVQVLTEGVSSCYVFRKISVKGYDLKDVDGKVYISDDLVKNPLYILVLPDNETVFFKRIRKKIVLKALPEKYRPVVKEILQKQHISLKNEAQLELLVQHLTLNQGYKLPTQ